MSDERPLAIIDIDGVVADVRHRLHHLRGRRKEWGEFFGAAGRDTLHVEGAAIVATLAVDHEVVFLTGRPSHLAAATARWLDANGLGGHRVVMRPPGDRRPAAVLKLELLGDLAAGRQVGMVVDDDPDVLVALRRAGYPTFAADWEGRPGADGRALHRAQESDGKT
jgi:phosphoglycolate phosphatase-like HAD superfamily hydrolase